MDGEPGAVGKWMPWKSPLWGNQSVHIDAGAFYAAKDMYDPKGEGRRIYWGWTAYISPAQGTLSLAREVSYINLIDIYWLM